VDLDQWPALRAQRAGGFATFGGQMPKVGERVGAIMSADKDEVRMFGWGVYRGDEVPPKDILFMGLPMARANPKIELEDGKTVFGCESWWGPEDAVKKAIGKRKIVMVDIDAERKRAKQASAGGEQEPAQ